MILNLKITTSATSHKLMISKHMQLERWFIFERLVANKAQIGSFLIMCSFCMFNKPKSIFECFSTCSAAKFFQHKPLLLFVFKS